MAMRTRTLLWAALMCFSSVFSVRAEQADRYIASLINSGDWLSLREALPQYRDSIQTPYLRLTADAMLAAHTNRPEDAIRALDELLGGYQEEIGSQAALDFALLRLYLTGMQGRYAEAADGMQRIINRLETAGFTETETLQAMYARYDALRSVAPPAVIRSGGNDSVPFRLIGPEVTRREEWMHSDSKAYTGNLISVPVRIHGIEQPFIFDTGAGATFLFEGTARRLGLTILPDTVTINGTQKGMRAVIDSLQIGGITCRNIIAYVGFPDAIDTLMNGMDAILGMDVIAGIGETQIRMDRQQLFFPAHPSALPEGAVPNMVLDGSLLLRAEQDGKPLMFHLDTGCSTAELYSDYYRMFAGEADRTAVRDTVTMLTYGEVTNAEVLLLPELRFSVSGTPVRMEDVYLYPSSGGYLHQHDGRLGMDFLRRFNCVTLNMKQMFLNLR